MKFVQIIAFFVVTFGVVLAIIQQYREDPLPDQPITGEALVDIVLPEQLSATAQMGKVAFEAKCAVCHGVNAVGQDGVAPPLIHKIYEPSHHGDEAFQRAVAQGVKGHHWPFGDMLPVPGLTRADVATIVAYIREVQQTNGIF